MKEATRVFCAVAMIGLFGSVGGCASSSADDWAQTSPVIKSDPVVKSETMNESSFVKSQPLINSKPVQPGKPPKSVVQMDPIDKPSMRRPPVQN